MSRHLDIVIPGLIWPNLADYPVLFKQLEVPHLEKLLKRTSRAEYATSYSDIYHGIPAYAESLRSNSNLAEYYAQQLGVHGFSGYLIAEPTHLRLDRNRLLIGESELLQLNQSESQEIISMLNEDLMPSQQIFYINDELWLIGVDFSTDGLDTTPLIDIIGKDIADYLVLDEAHLALSRLFNNLQLMLATLALNEERVGDGLLEINGLWLWNKRLSHKVKFGKILTSNPKLGTQITDLFKQLPQFDSLILDSVYFAASYGDGFAWQELVERLDREVFAQITRLIENGDITSFSLLVPSLEGGVQFNWQISDQWKFWRQTRLLKLKNND